MKIVLTKDVPNVGRAGQLKDVADGFARNYLIPRGLASAATKRALKETEVQHAAEKRREAKSEAADSAIADQVAKTTLVFQVRVGEQHRLYGSITSGDIADALSAKLGKSVDKRDIELEEPLKHLGTFKVPVRIGHKFRPEVAVTLEKED